MGRNKALERAKAVWAAHNPDKGESLTKSFVRWALDKAVPRKAYCSGHRAWCSRCGHSFGCEESAGHAVCPRCGARLEVEPNRKGSARAVEYVQQLTAWEEYQVVRTYILDISQRKGEGETVGIWRVYDWLFSEDGGMWCFSRNVRMFSLRMRNPWDTRRPMGYRARPDGANSWRSGWLVSADYPVRRYQPWARRLGFHGDFMGFDARDVLVGLRTKPCFETVWKDRHERLSHFILYNGGERWWPQIKIARRAGFAFGDPRMWEDYMRDLGRLGYDTSNPKYIAPADLAEAHARAAREIGERSAAEARRKEREARSPGSAANRKYAARMGKALGFVARSGDIEIRPLQTVGDFLEEGRELRHCVYANGYYERENSLILGARVKGKRTETIEVDTRRMTVEQCRGRHNQDSPYHKQILALIRRSLPRLRRYVAGL